MVAVPGLRGEPEKMAMKQVLVGTLRHGEQEYEQCVRALHRQRGVSFDHFTLSDLPNKAAHDALYRQFMDSAAGYGYFLKLDADMVFRDSSGLAIMVKEIAEENGAHLFMDVLDWPSQMPIPGVQMFRSDCLWRGSDDRLNVDYAPALHGPLRRDFSTTLVDHMPNPSKFQAFRYGIHKALKAAQPDRRDKNFPKALTHATILAGIARHWRLTRDERLLFALIGAMLVFRTRAKDLLDDYAGGPATDRFERLLSDPNALAKLTREAEDFWQNEIQFFLGWYSYLPDAVWGLPS